MTKEEERLYNQRYAAAHRDERREYYRQYHLAHYKPIRRYKKREQSEFRLPVENAPVTTREVFYELELMP
jgi:hypothetical protein